MKLSLDKHRVHGIWHHIADISRIHSASIIYPLAKILARRKILSNYKLEYELFILSAKEARGFEFM